jgi:hypothetical protein
MKIINFELEDHVGAAERVLKSASLAHSVPTHHYRTTKLASKLLSGSQTGKAPADIRAAIFIIFPARPMRHYAEARMEIIHGPGPHASQTAFRHSNFDYIREV